MNSDDDSFLRRASCCGSFWGPFRPRFGGHTLAEAGSSAILPTFVLLVTRLSSAVFMLATFIYFTVRGTYGMEFFSSWSHLGLSLSLALSTALSLSYMMTARTSGSGEIKFSRLAFFGVLMFQIFSSAALFLDPVYWILVFEGGTPKFHQLAQHAVNLGLVVLDIVLSMHMDFRLMYVWIFVGYAVIYLGFAWVYFAITDEFTYTFLDHRNKAAGLVVAYYLGVVAWGVVAALIILVLSRISRLPCAVRRAALDAATEEDSDFA